VKAYLSLSLLALLLACGESRIQSVDDEVLEKSHADKAAADLKLAQSTLIGAWTVCQDNEDGSSIRYDYSFATDNKLLLNEATHSTAQCSSENPESTRLEAGWKLIPTKDETAFTLHLTWGEGKKLESEYQSSGAQAELPNLIALKDESDLSPIKLTEQDRFLKLDKVKTTEKNKAQKTAETFLMDFASGLLHKKGSWQSACEGSKNSSLKFSGDKDLKVTITRQAYEDKDCKTLKEVEFKNTVDFKLTAVVDLEQRTIAVTAGEEKRNLKVSLKDLDKLELSEAGDRSKIVTSYTFQAGVTP
jgi:hypothetical protein